MSRKLITKERIIEATLKSAFEKSMGESSLADIASTLEIKKASLYNHFSSKEEILKAIYTFCSDYYQNVNLITNEMLEQKDKSIEEILIEASKRFFLIHERDTLYKIYTFINSEKYFRVECLNIYTYQKSKIEKEIFLFLKTAIKNEKIAILADEKLKAESSIFCNSLFSLLDLYLATRKETIRQNPECDAGSLFALPSDTNALAELQNIVSVFLQNL